MKKSDIVTTGPAEASRPYNAERDTVRRAFETGPNRSKVDLSKRRELSAVQHIDTLTSTHADLQADYQGLVEARQKISETINALSSGVSNLRDWSKLYVDSQALLKYQARLSSPDHQRTIQSLREATDTLTPLCESLDPNTQVSLEETSQMLQTLDESQGIGQNAQTYFLESSKAIRKALYRDSIKGAKDFEGYVKPFIQRYTETDPNNFYRVVALLRAEQTNNVQEKPVSIKYYNPKDRVMLAYSSSREEQSNLLKPLYEGETKKKIYERTLSNSEEMRHVQEAAVTEYNKEHSEQISLEDMPDLTIVCCTLANEKYKAVRPRLKLTENPRQDCHPGDERFKVLEKEVPIIKGINYLLSQRYPHLEITEITILPNPSADSAIVHATRKSSWSDSKILKNN